MAEDDLFIVTPIGTPTHTANTAIAAIASPALAKGVWNRAPAPLLHLLIKHE